MTRHQGMRATRTIRSAQGPGGPRMVHACWTCAWKYYRIYRCGGLIRSFFAPGLIFGITIGCWKVIYGFYISNPIEIIGLLFVELKIWPKYRSMYDIRKWFGFRKLLITLLLQVRIELMIYEWKSNFKGYPTMEDHWLTKSIWM